MLWSRIINTRMNQWSNIIVTGLFIMMVMVVTLLCIEYQFFIEQTIKLRKIKREYRQHVLHVKQMLGTYIHTPSKESYGVAMIRSAEELLRVNRSSTYLKKSSVSYAKRYNTDLVSFYRQPELWLDYTDEQLMAQQPMALLGEDIHISVADVLAFIWPIDKTKFWLSSFFGPRKQPNGRDRFHYGIDMAALKGTPVYVAADGKVEQAYNDFTGYGNTIVVKHNGTYKTRYAHLDMMLVEAGQDVQAGTIIGRVGDTGNVRKQGRDASHLHFEVYALGKRVNPLYFLS